MLGSDRHQQSGSVSESQSGVQLVVVIAFVVTAGVTVDDAGVVGFGEVKVS